MKPPPPANSWSRRSAPHPDVSASSEVSVDAGWQIKPLAEGDDRQFRNVRVSFQVRLLTLVGKYKAMASLVALGLAACAVYCYLAPAGSIVGGLPAQYVAIALTLSALGAVLLTALGVRRRQLESVEDALRVLGVPLIGMSRRANSDVQ